jgi:hypothetical protein
LLSYIIHEFVTFNVSRTARTQSQFSSIVTFLVCQSAFDSVTRYQQMWLG